MRKKRKNRGLQPIPIKKSVSIDLNTTKEEEVDLMMQFLRSQGRYIFRWKGKVIGTFKVIDKTSEVTQEEVDLWNF